jgi:hypothetical protein
VAVSDPMLRERCTKQPVQTVERKLKCLSYPIRRDRCTAENVTEIIDRKDIRINALFCISFFCVFSIKPEQKYLFMCG